MERETDLKVVLSSLERQGAPGTIIALFGPGSVIYPVEDRIVRAASGGDRSRINIDVVECEGLTEEAIYNRLKSRTLLGGQRILVLRAISKGQFTDLKELSLWARRKKRRDDPILILEDDAPPNTKALKEFIRGFAQVIDLSMRGLSKRDQLKKARELLISWLKEAGRSMTQDAMDLFLNTVDIEDTSYLKTELEKVISSTKEDNIIDAHDVARIAVSSRQEEIYRLTDALGKMEKRTAYMVLSNLLMHGVHPLGILQLFSIWLSRLLVLKAVERDAKQWQWITTPSFSTFKRDILPLIKNNLGDPLPIPLQGLRPYAIYNLFLASTSHDVGTILEALRDLPELDMELKSASTPPVVVLEKLMERFLQ